MLAGGTLKRGAVHTSHGRSVVGLTAGAFALAGTLLVNPHSVIGFVYFMLIWGVLIILIDSAEIVDFAFAFLVNSTFLVTFVLVQAHVYPDSYGTTSPYGSWTDDSYFFALVADSIPTGMVLRDNYFIYTDPFSDLVRAVTPFTVQHPLDVLFFQSGVAALLSTYSAKLAFQITGDWRLRRTVYVLMLMCPFLMMNGGVIFIRDTFSAALLACSFCFLNERRWLVAALAVLLQFDLRPGTAILLAPAYVLFFFPEIRTAISKHWIAATFAAAAVVGIGVYGAPMLPDLIQGTDFNYKLQTVGLLGRDIIADLTADPDANKLFLAIQALPFAIRVVLNGAYIFAYPFFGFKYIFNSEYFDLRSVTLNLIVPIYSFWLNAWFITGAITSLRSPRRQRALVISIFATLLLVGTYSLQTRHKTIIYPFYYFAVAVGLHYGSVKVRRLGYIVSGLGVLCQLAIGLM